MASSTGGDGVTGTVVEEARAELERAARELEKLTDELNERTQMVARLEGLADALLDMVAAPAVVVDPEGTVVAVSRGAAARYPALADAVGHAAKTTVPNWDVEQADGDDPRAVELPDGSKLLVLEA